jgi:tetratricopeptide (TPR) repeat protein
VKETATIRLPAGFAAEQELSSPVHETVAGVEYVRTEKVDGDVLTVNSSERSVVSEVAYKDAVAAEARLRALDQDDVYLRMADNYKPTDNELAALAGSTPANASEYLKRGNLYLDRWKLDEAISDYSKAIELDPKNEWALADRSLAYVWKNDHALAEKDAAAVERLNARNPVLWRARGLLGVKRGDCKAAVAAFSKSLEIEPNSEFARGHRAQCEHRLGQDEEALADSALALKGDKSWMDLRSMRANILLSQGKRDSVATEIDQLVQDNPQSDLAWVMAGKIYAQIGMQAKAMTAFDRALAIKPQPYAYINRARARPETDRSGRTSDLEAALKLKPDDVDTMAEVAGEYAQQGDFTRSLAIYDRLVVPTPGYSDYAVLRAAVLQKIGRTSEAAKILATQRARAKTAKDLNNLCWTKATNGIMLESALQDCRDALKLSPDSGQYLDSLGMALLKLGKLVEALAAYDQAVAKSTGADSLMGRAFVYARKGDRPRADQDAAAARKIYPEIDSLFAQYGLKL